MRRLRTYFIRGTPIILLVLILLAGLVWAQKPQGYDGRSAYFNGWEDHYDGSGWNGYKNTYVQVMESMGSGGTQWNLTFDVEYVIFNPFSYGRASGSGPIPDNSVESSPPKNRNLRVQVDAATLPWAYVDGDIELGIIDLEWNRSPEIWNRTVGHRMERIGEWLVHSQGTSVEYSATIEGSIFGDPVGFSNYWAYMQEYQNMWKSISRTPPFPY